jgi:hypothetical protein
MRANQNLPSMIVGSALLGTAVTLCVVWDRQPSDGPFAPSAPMGILLRMQDEASGRILDDVETLFFRLMHEVPGAIEQIASGHYDEAAQAYRIVVDRAGAFTLVLPSMDPYEECVSRSIPVRRAQFTEHHAVLRRRLPAHGE